MSTHTIAQSQTGSVASECQLNDVPECCPKDSSPLPDSPPPAEPRDALAQLKRKWAVYNHGTLKQRCLDLESHQYLIADLIPKRSLSIVVGDSGLGKSPLLYQAALCVAAGIPFLGRPVSRGRVLYIDFENGLGGVEDLVSQLASHLGLPTASEDLLLFNFNDSPPKWEPSNLGEMVADLRPEWIIIDPIAAYAPEIDSKNDCVTRTYHALRGILKDNSTTATMIHHIRKLPTQPGVTVPGLEDDTRGWFQQARGPRQLINGADIRIGIDKCRRADAWTELDGRSVEVALVLAGFGRLRETIEPMYLGRVLGEDDKPMGYEQLRGASLLFNSDRQAAYGKLPDPFTFTQAKQTLAKGSQATTDFLNKCQSVGILRKEGRQYRKLKVADSAD
jgi:hypothetical protein